MLRLLTPFGRRSELSAAENPILSLQRQMTRLLDDVFPGYLAPGNSTTILMPSMDVKETDKTFEIEAELPGVEEKDIQVTFEDGVLTVKGEKKAEMEESDAGYYMSERSYGSFLRSLELPPGIDAEKIAAKFDKGVLKVTLPKLAESRATAKKIEVNAAN
jgi:HSP20 family protein